MESPSDGSEGFQPRPAPTASSCEDPSDRAQTHRQPGLMRIPVDAVGIWPAIRGGRAQRPRWFSWIVQPPWHTATDGIARRVPSACGLMILGATILQYLRYWECPFGIRFVAAVQGFGRWSWTACWTCQVSRCPAVARFLWLGGAVSWRARGAPATASQGSSCQRGNCRSRYSNFAAMAACDGLRIYHCQSKRDSTTSSLVIFMTSFINGNNDLECLRHLAPVIVYFFVGW